MKMLLCRRILFNVLPRLIRKTPCSVRYFSSLSTYSSSTWIRTANVVPSLQFNRCKSRANKKKEKSTTQASDDEEESDEDTADFDSLLVDKNTKILTVKVNSLRADVILKSGLSIARKKIEELFYESKIRVNGKKIYKKSDPLEVGDEVDIIKGVSLTNSNFLMVARVEVLDIKPKSESLSVRLRRCKNLTIENYEDAWHPGD